MELTEQQRANALLKLAKQGDADGQFELALCYEDGKGVEQNFGEAIKWYRLAAEQGNTDAQYNLGICYAEGRGVRQNWNESFKWSKSAAKQGDNEA